MAFPVLCLIILPFLIAGNMDGSLSGFSKEPVPVDGIGAANRVSLAPLHFPIYRIPLRVHLGKSGRSPGEFREILGEINHIWLSQAGICFEIEAVQNDKVFDNGLDIWFLPRINGDDALNGYYRNDHEILVRDTPILAPASDPARHPAARTAAHEFGHALELSHRQDSDDNLMRSKTYGWRLSESEVFLARDAAAGKALPDVKQPRCGPPRLVL